AAPRLLWALVVSICLGTNNHQPEHKAPVSTQRHEGETVTLGCFYETSHLFCIFWYKQYSSGEMIFLILHELWDENKEDSHCSVYIQEATKTVSFTISVLQQENSSEHFCA
ncbi:T-cell receptor alpha chain V region HPB-MLT, partial [Heterocephalus glaber]